MRSGPRPVSRRRNPAAGLRDWPIRPSREERPREVRTLTEWTTPATWKSGSPDVTLLLTIPSSRRVAVGARPKGWESTAPSSSLHRRLILASQPHHVPLSLSQEPPWSRHWGQSSPEPPRRCPSPTSHCDLSVIASVAGRARRDRRTAGGSTRMLEPGNQMGEVLWHEHSQRR